MLTIQYTIQRVSLTDVNKDRNIEEASIHLLNLLANYNIKY